MVQRVYSVFDKKAEEFLPPFVCKNDAVAVRSFNHGLRETPFPKDHELYCLGEIDLVKGVLIPSGGHPQRIMTDVSVESEGV